MSEQIEISYIIPAYNEEKNIPILYNRIIDASLEIGKDFEIIFIDDGSTDETAKVLDSIKNDHVKIIKFKRNAGQTAAFDAGFKMASGKVIVTMDADNQNDPRDVSKLLKTLKDYDAVCGWRKKRNDPFVKRISSKIANSIRNILSNEEIHDTGCSLKAFKKECIMTLKLYNGMHRFFPTLLKMEGFKVAEIEVSHHPRKHGKSKYNIRNRIFTSFFDLLAVRWMKKRKLDYEVIE